MPPGPCTQLFVHLQCENVNFTVISLAQTILDDFHNEGEIASKLMQSKNKANIANAMKKQEFEKSPKKLTQMTSMSFPR